MEKSFYKDGDILESGNGFAPKGCRFVKIPHNKNSNWYTSRFTDFLLDGCSDTVRMYNYFDNVWSEVEDRRLYCKLQDYLSYKKGFFGIEHKDGIDFKVTSFSYINQVNEIHFIH